MENRLHGLDAMRGLAAICVVLFHAHSTFDGFPGWWGKGYLAVDFFMILSGYVMSRTYEARIGQGLGTIGFLRLRYRRLWPTMAIASLLACPLLIAGGLNYRSGGRWAVLSGMLSFPLYAIHIPVLRLSHQLGIDGTVATALALLAGMVFCAIQFRNELRAMFQRPAGFAMEPLPAAE